MENLKHSVSTALHIIISLAAILLLLQSITTAYAKVQTQLGGVKAGTQSSQIEIRRLEVGKPIEREMKGGESHTYEIALEVGQYLNVVVNQRGIDVVVIVINPNGQQLMEVDSPNGAQGPEPVELVAEVSGNYRLTVGPSEKEAVKGHYEIQIVMLRVATTDERALQEARNLYAESVRLKNKRQYDASLPLAERDLRIREKVLGPERAEVAESLDNLAGIYRAQSNYAKAEPLYLRALNIREKTLGPNHMDVAESLNNLAILYQQRGEYEKAEPLFQRFLVVLEKMLGSDHSSIVAALNNLAALYYFKGDYAKAEPLYLRALNIREKNHGPNHPGVALSLNNLAALYYAKGDYAKAEPLYQRALAIRENSLGPEHADVAQSLNNLALLYDKKGDYAKVEPLHQRALAIREKSLGSDHPDVAQSLNNLALYYARKGEYRKAEPLFLRSLKIWEKSGGPNHPDVALLLANLAALYNDNGDFDKAEPLYQRSLAIREKSLGPEHPSIAQSLNSLALLYEKKGDYDRAEVLYKRSLMIAEKIIGSESPDVATVLDNLAWLYETQGKIEAAIESRLRSNDISERNILLNIATGSEQQKSLYLSTLRDQAHNTISLHIRSAPNNYKASRLALLAVFRQKGRALDAMTDSIGALRRRLNPKDSKLLDSLTEVRSRLATLVLKGPGKTNPALYQAEIRRLEEQVEKLEIEVSTRSAEFRAQSQPISFNAIQTAIPRNNVLLEFVLYRPSNLRYKKREEQYGTPRYIAYVLHNQGEAQWVELGEAKTIDMTVGALRIALRDPNRGDVQQLARIVEEKVFQPVRKLLGNTHKILLSPDGALNLIPFAALIDEKNQYLVKRYSFTYLTSGRDLLRLQEHLPSKQGAMIIANPDYGPMSGEATGRGVKTSKPVVVVKGKATAAKDETASTEAIDFSQIEFPALTGTEQEARALKAMLPEATMILREKATKAAVQQVNAPDILHIATHGFFLENAVSGSADEAHGTSIDGQSNASVMRIKDPLQRSGLALAGANLRRSDDNGILTALEVSGLNLWGTKLVVLSACETGVGEVQNFNGVIGLRRALFLAGSESQMLSLWKVDDEATRDLMVDYYRRLKAGEGRSEALRQVQLKMLASRDRQHPYFWASFIESGEWANLDSKR